MEDYDALLSLVEDEGYTLAELVEQGLCPAWLFEEVQEEGGRMLAREATGWGVMAPGSEAEFGMTLQQIGNVMHMSRERVRQIAQNAILKLRRRAKWDRKLSQTGEDLTESAALRTYQKGACQRTRTTGAGGYNL